MHSGDDAVVEALHKVVLGFMASLVAASCRPANREREVKPRRSKRAAPTNTSPEKLLRTAQELHVVAVALSHIKSTCMCTERDVMYTAPALFRKNQRCTARTIERVCRLMASNTVREDCRATYTRESLHIVACAKSLIIGHIQFQYRSNVAGHWDAVHCDAMSAPTGVGHAITPTMAMTAHGFTHCSWSDVSPSQRGSGAGTPEKLFVVLVEKEATLQHLVHFEHVLKRLPITLVCTRGYPCVASRILFRRLLHDRPQPSHTIFLALTDGDPHGLRIALTWMGIHGQRVRSTPTWVGSSTNEGSDEDPGRIIAMRWIGIPPRRADPTQRIPFTSADENLLESVINTLETQLSTAMQPSRSHSITSCVVESLQNLHREALIMQQGKVKCELQAATHGLLPLLQEAVLRTSETH